MRHVYNEETGKRIERRGKPVVRHAKCPPPCQTSVGCAKGQPTGRPGCKELTAKNWRAFQHYRECLAVGQFPNDATVRRNASVIRMAEESARESKQAGSIGPLLSLLGGRKHGR